MIVNNICDIYPIRRHKTPRLLERDRMGNIK